MPKRRRKALCACIDKFMYMHAYRISSNYSSFQFFVAFENLALTKN